MADHGSNVHENRDSIVHGQSSLGCLQLRFRTTKQSIEIKLLNRKKSHLYIPPPFCIAIMLDVNYMSIAYRYLFYKMCVYNIHWFFSRSPRWLDGVLSLSTVFHLCSLVEVEWRLSFMGFAIQLKMTLNAFRYFIKLY